MRPLSPNFDDRPEGVQVDVLVMHYTGMKTAEEALARLNSVEDKVSAHYLIHENGEVVQLVPENKRAWHAGVSSWRGRERLNDTSIGIELVNPGHEFGYRPFPAVQMLALIDLCKDILERHPIPTRNVVGHSDIAPSRKEDPGELFDWRMLAREGIGLWPELPKELPDFLELDVGMLGPEVESLQRRLVQYGYSLKADGYFGNATQAAVKAFQRHFTPRQVNGAWAALQEAALVALLAEL
jgi:N-acetylmuramoyl-L-alanine amidase